MKSIANLFILFLLMTSCSTKEKQTSTLNYRILHVVEGDSLFITREYDLVKDNHEEVEVYQYVNLEDKKWNMTFKYNKSTKVLSFVDSDFELKEKDKFFDPSLSSVKFDLYTLSQPVIDGHGPLLFNSDYGILNLDNGLWKSSIYLKENDTTNKVQQILTMVRE
ncbi:hypothetical protein [Flammeovirga aprica]|uniref:Lipoprotein n=1 Tax=Flammeovirga aprica JL-4 TaxID=694437 RepID=A0A7X9RXQ2_9BACT|nr:hypothetical protein [Flammeovirga aprica]NME70650.1 hypothetical protein [Flammeovirga aprica JL-4]